MASIHVKSQPLLLTLPRELRDEMYRFLALPEHVFTSAPNSRDHSLRRLNTTLSEAHIDTRIYVPIRAPTNLLGTCRQLREECLDTISYLVNSSSAKKGNNPQPMADSKNSHRAAKENSELEEISERARDDGTIRITLEMARPVRTSMGAYIPTRESPSPYFLALLPMLIRVKKVKFVVWGAYDWGKGPQQRYITVPKSRRLLRTG